MSGRRRFLPWVGFPLLTMGLAVGLACSGPSSPAIVYEAGMTATSSTAWAISDAADYLSKRNLKWGKVRVILKRGSEYWIYYEAPATTHSGNRRVLAWKGPGEITEP